MIDLVSSDDETDSVASDDETCSVASMSTVVDIRSDEELDQMNDDEYDDGDSWINDEDESEATLSGSEDESDNEFIRETSVHEPAVKKMKIEQNQDDELQLNVDISAPPNTLWTVFLNNIHTKFKEPEPRLLVILADIITKRGFIFVFDDDRNFDACRLINKQDQAYMFQCCSMKLTTHEEVQNGIQCFSAMGNHLIKLKSHVFDSWLNVSRSDDGVDVGKLNTLFKEELISHDIHFSG